MLIDSNTTLLIKHTDCMRTRIALIKDGLGWTAFLSNDSIFTRKIITKILAIAATENQSLQSGCFLAIARCLADSDHFRQLENNINWCNVDPIRWKYQSDRISKKDIPLEFFENIKEYFNKEKFRISMVHEICFITYDHGHDINVVSDDGTHIKYFKNIYTGYWEQLDMFQKNENKRIG